MTSAQHIKDILKTYRSISETRLNMKLLALMNKARLEGRMQSNEMKRGDISKDQNIHFGSIEDLTEVAEDIILNIMSANGHESSYAKATRIIEQLPENVEYDITLIPDSLVIHFINEADNNNIVKFRNNKFCISR